MTWLRSRSALPQSAEMMIVEYPWAANIDTTTQMAAVAAIAELDTTAAKNEIDAVWWNGIQNRAEQPDGHWIWADIVQEFRYRRSHETLAIRTSDGVIQAAAVLNLTKGKSVLADGGCVFVEYLAVAPWNRKPPIGMRRFSGCASQILLCAACHSYNLGFMGRIGGFSLPEAEELYVTLGFQPTEKIHQIQLTRFFELPAAAANEWMRREGKLK